MTRITKIGFLILAAALSCSAQVRTVCVMPVQDNAAVQQAVEQWVHEKGLQTVDCIHTQEKGDAVLGFFANQAGWWNRGYFIYHRANYLTVLRQSFPGMGITIWLQSHREGETVGGLFIGRMLYYGQAANLHDGLNQIWRAIRHSNPVQ